MNSRPSFWTELKRRNVFRVAAAYVVVAWLLVQAADILLGNFGAPAWVFKSFASLLTLGLPLALFLSWAYELTPEGMKKTEAVHPAESVTPQTGRKLDFLIIGVLAVALGWFVWDKFGVTAERPAIPSETAQASIAVLPFQNLGPPEDAYFAAGMTDEITTRLGAVSGLQVISRLGALGYGGANKSPNEIGAELGVRYILSGSVRWAGGGTGRVRITPELIRASDGAQLWSQPYDRVIEDIFSVQSDIARQVAERLGITLLRGERASLARRPTDNLAAYTLYLRGRHFWNKRTEENLRVALDYFQQAVDLDPTYALAHVGIADIWISRGWYSRLAPRETFPRAKAAVGRALEIDPTLAEAHTSLAHIHLEFDYEWDAAEQEYLRAIELNPNYPVAHHWYGGYLSAMGRHEEAMEQALRARELDPLSLIINTWVGLRHYFAGRYEEAIEAYRKALELDPDFVPGRWHLGWALGKAGRHEEAIVEAQKAIELSGDNPLYVASLGHAYAAAGRDREARQVLGRLEGTAETVHVSAYHVAMVHAALGDGDEAFRWLDLAYEERSPWMGYVGVDPRSEQLRPDPRFARLLERLRLAY